MFNISSSSKFEGSGGNSGSFFHQYPSKMGENPLDPYLLFTAYKYKLLPPTENIEKIDNHETIGGVKLFVPGGITYSVSNAFSDESYKGSVSGWLNTGIEFARTHISPIHQVIQGGSGGRAIYPASVKLYQKTDFISLNLNFKMIPRNKTEAQNIDGIVGFFKNCALPGKTNGNMGVGQVLVEPPAIFTIKFVYSKKHESSQAQDILKWKNMVISNISVSFSPDSESFLIFEDGKPVSVSLSLNFDSITPVEPVDRNF